MSTSPVTTLSAADPILADIIERTELPPLPESSGLYLDLLSCILDQTIPARSRGVYLRKLVTLLGGEQPDANNVYTIQEEDWTAAKIARAKYHALFGLADWWNETGGANRDWAALSDDEIRKELISLKGVGPQTVDVILLYTLSRPDVFPVGDYHLKQIMEALYLEEGEKLKPKMLAVAEKWAPYRSLGTRYLLAYKAAAWGR